MGWDSHSKIKNWPTGKNGTTNNCAPHQPTCAVIGAMDCAAAYVT